MRVRFVLVSGPKSIVESRGGAVSSLHFAAALGCGKAAIVWVRLWERAGVVVG